MKTLLSTLLTAFFFSVILSLPLTSIAQGENNIWAFGDNEGLDFNGGDPTLISTKVKTGESSGAVANKAGVLQFYVSVPQSNMPNCIWDKTNNIMPNGNDLLGNYAASCSKGILIVPFIKDTSRYYVFILSAVENRLFDNQMYLRYSVVDMSLRGGLGDVVSGQKNIIIDSFTSEQMTIAKSGDCALWLVILRADTLAFNSFRIDETGIANKPIVSGFPSARSSMTAPSAPEFIAANMNIAPDNKYLVLSRPGSPPKTEVYDFDINTGIVSNQRVLDNIFGSLCFSPKGTKLYSTYSTTTQYNWSLMPNIAAVKASAQIVWDSSLKNFRIGPDDKMYTLTVSKGLTDTQKILRINSPELTGVACNFEQYKRTKQTIQCSSFGLPIITLAAATSTSSRTDTTICQASQATLWAATGYNSYTWSNGSVGETLQVSQDGTYWVQMLRECSSHTDTFVVRIVNIPTILKPTDSICNNSEILLDATTPLASYLWQDASTAATYTASKEGNYTVVIKVGPCQSTQTTTISNKSFSIDLGEDKKLCDGESVLLKVDAAFDAMAWNDGSTADTLVVTNSGQYAVMVQKGICIAKDSIQIDFVGCSNCIALPNAFSPNNDNKNDYYRPILNCNVLSYSFKVYNRYGQEVFATKNPADKWDGSFKGKTLDLGVYYYFVKVQFDYPNAQEELYKGDITLIR